MNKPPTPPLPEMTLLEYIEWIQASPVCSQSILDTPVELLVDRIVGTLASYGGSPRAYRVIRAEDGRHSIIWETRSRADWNAVVAQAIIVHAQAGRNR